MADDMRKFIQIVEGRGTPIFENKIGLPSTKLCEMLLYRGDSSQIDKFDFNATDRGALLGPGLYLTSDPDVAHDYTAARQSERVFPKRSDEGEYKTTKDLIIGYLRYLASEFNESKFKDGWCQKNGYGEKYNGLSIAAHRRLDDDMKTEKRRSFVQKFPEAFERVRHELPSLSVMKLTTNQLVLVKKIRQAAISTFNIPDDYLSRTLHADQPLPDVVLEAIKQLWLKAYPNDNGDLRDYKENRVGFDAYIQNYRKHGTRYAWSDEDRIVGGNDQNPSLDDIRNGTHGGNYAFSDGMFDQGTPKSNDLIKTLMNLGYVGLEYDGGNSMGQNVRGGGGRKHRAFVFWDVNGIQKFRTDNHPLPKLKRVTMRSLPND